MRRVRPLYLFTGLVGAGVAFVAALDLFYGGGITLFRGEARIAGLVKEHLSSGKVLVIPSGFDMRTYKKEMLRQRVAQIKVLVTGSSRILWLGSAFFDVDSRVFFNAGVAGSPMEYHAIVWQICKEQQRIPAVVFLGLDPWILNEKAEESRFIEFDSDLQRFKYSRLGLWPSVLNRLPDQSVWSYWLKVTDLMSAYRLQRTLDVIRGNLRGEKPLGPGDDEAVLMNPSEVPKESVGFRLDGSLKDDRTRTQGRLLNKAATQLMQNAQAGKFFKFRNWSQLSRVHMGLLDSLLSEMKGHGVRVIGFMPPYAPEYWGLLAQHEDYLRLLRGQSEFLRKKFLQYQFEYYDMLDPAVVGLASEDFQDPIHPNRAGMVKVLKYLNDHSAIVKDGTFRLKLDSLVSHRN